MAKVGKKQGESPGKPKSGGPGGGDQRSIRGRGNALRSAIVLGATIALVPLLIAGAYLYLVRAPAHEDALAERITQTYARQQAHVIAEAVADLGARIEAAARSPLALQAIAEQNPSDIRLVEQAMLDHFPRAVSLRLLPLGEMGTADLEGGFQGLRNHIEVDLVRRVSNGDEAQPEAYQFEGQWLASMARITTHPRIPSRRAVVLVSLSGERIEEMLRYPGEMPGRFVLEQRVYGESSNRSTAVFSIGSGDPAYAQAAAIEGTPWRVIVEPSTALLEIIADDTRPDYDVLLLALLCTLAGFGLSLQRIGQALGGELDRIIAGAEHRTPMEVGIPQLVPIAKELRKLTLRRARTGNGGSVVPTAELPGATSTAPALTAVEGPSSTGLPPNIFRAYDIRGIADTELDDETVYRIGSAIGTIAGELGEQTLILGSDGRASSSRIKGVVEKALPMR